MCTRMAKVLAFLRQEERELTKLLRQKIEADRLRKILVNLNAMLKSRQAWKHPCEA